MEKVRGLFSSSPNLEVQIEVLLKYLEIQNCKFGQFNSYFVTEIGEFVFKN